MAGFFLRKPRPSEKEPMAIKKGLAQYIYLLKNVSVEQISTESFQVVYSGFFDFRGERLKQNGKFWREYFQYMQENCGKELNFNTVLERLQQIQGKIEVSFGSKLLSMLNSDEKIPWDRRVEGVLKPYFNTLGVIVPSDEKNTKKYKDDKEKYICDWNVFYAELCDWYTGFVGIQKELGERSWLKQFNQWFENDWYEWYLNNLRAKNTKMKRPTTKPVYEWFHDQPLRQRKEMSGWIEPVKVIDLVLWQRGYFPYDCSRCGN